MARWWGPAAPVYLHKIPGGGGAQTPPTLTFWFWCPGCRDSCIRLDSSLTGSGNLIPANRACPPFERSRAALLSDFASDGGLHHDMPYWSPPTDPHCAHPGSGGVGVC